MNRVAMLVTGATGQVGYHLMESLADAGDDATAMVRVPAKAVDLPGSPKHLVATLDAPPSAEQLRAFDHVFLLSPAHEGQVELELIFIDALVADGRVGFVSASDVATVAAAVLTSGGHEDETYVVTGPESLTFADIAARVSAAFGREVDYDDMPVLLAKDQMQASGLSPWQTEGTLELFDWIRHGGTDSVTSTVPDISGSDARTIDDWLSEQRGTFLAPR